MTGQSGENMKSAYERAMERVANLQPASKEKRLEWKGVPEGTAHAVKFLKGQGDLAAALKAADKELAPYVIRGMVEVLTANTVLPKTPNLQGAFDRSVVGLRALFKGNKKVEEVLGRIQYVADQYKSYGTQQRTQIFEDLKRQFATQLQETMRRQGVQAPQAPPNVESLPEFQQEWARIRIQMDQQYDDHLDAFRRELRAAAGA